MAKIKNWEKLSKKTNAEHFESSGNTSYHLWRYDDIPGVFLEVYSAGSSAQRTRGKTYAIRLKNGQGNTIQHVNPQGRKSNFSNRQKAKEAAVEWMKKHPVINVNPVFG